MTRAYCLDAAGRKPTVYGEQNLPKVFCEQEVTWSGLFRMTCLCVSFSVVGQSLKMRFAHSLCLPYGYDTGTSIL